MRRRALTAALLAALSFGAFPARLPGSADPPEAWLPTMAAATRLAWRDAQTLDPATAEYVRYFYDPEEEYEPRDENFNILSLQLNLLSRGPNIHRPLRISANLCRVDLRNYKIDPVVFANARVADAYFHTKIKYPDGKVDFAVPAYLPQAEIEGLAQKLASGTKSVIYRSDWFIFATGIQEDRDGFGYYDFLGLKSGKDVDELAGHDQAKAEKEYAELAAVIRKSGVSIFSRQVFRYGTRRSCYWETRDNDNQVDDGNAQSRLFKDYKFKGKEIVFGLPNGLAGFALENNKDELVKSGPPNLVGDKRPGFNGQDARVHVGAGCITCHAGGALRPLNDYYRKVFIQGRGVGLGSPDKDLSERIKRVYLGPIQEAYEHDAGLFAKGYLAAAGIPAASVPRTYIRVWERYRGALDSTKAARELDTTKDCLRAALAWRATTGTGLDPALAGFLGPEADEEPVERPVFEAGFVLLKSILADWEAAGRPGPKKP